MASDKVSPESRLKGFVAKFVFAAADKLGMRPLGIVSVDETWSAFRLRPGRKGEGR